MTLKDGLVWIAEPVIDFILTSSTIMTCKSDRLHRQSLAHPARSNPSKPELTMVMTTAKVQLAYGHLWIPLPVLCSHTLRSGSVVSQNHLFHTGAGSIISPRAPALYGS